MLRPVVSRSSQRELCRRDSSPKRERRYGDVVEASCRVQSDEIALGIASVQSTLVEEFLVDALDELAMTEHMGLPLAAYRLSVWQRMNYL